MASRVAGDRDGHGDQLPVLRAPDMEGGVHGRSSTLSRGGGGSSAVGEVKREDPFDGYFTASGSTGAWLGMAVVAVAVSRGDAKGANEDSEVAKGGVVAGAVEVFPAVAGCFCFILALCG